MAMLARASQLECNYYSRGSFPLIFWEVPRDFQYISTEIVGSLDVPVDFLRHPTDFLAISWEFPGKPEGFREDFM
jgi:hypothetical protein